MFSWCFGIGKVGWVWMVVCVAFVFKCLVVTWLLCRVVLLTLVADISGLMVINSVVMIYYVWILWFLFVISVCFGC